MKSISEINYANGGKLTANLFFNKEGFITKQESFNPDGSLVRRWLFTYDNQNHKLTRSCYVLKDSLSYIVNFHYNIQGKLTSSKLVKSNGVLGGLDSIEYDTRLNSSFERNYGENNILQNSILKKFNKNNQVAEESYIDYILHSKGKQTYKYNRDKLTEEISGFKDKDNLLNRIRYTYFDNKNIEKIYQYDSFNKLVFMTKYTYDKQGYPVAIVELFPNNKIKNNNTYTYQYDKHGNWTCFFGYVNKKLETIMTRKIEYYGH